MLLFVSIVEIIVLMVLENSLLKTGELSKIKRMIKRRRNMSVLKRSKKKSS